MSWTVQSPLRGLQHNKRREYVTPPFSTGLRRVATAQRHPAGVPRGVTPLGVEEDGMLLLAALDDGDFIFGQAVQVVNQPVIFRVGLALRDFSRSPLSHGSSNPTPLLPQKTVCTWSTSTKGVTSCRPSCRVRFLVQCHSSGKKVAVLSRDLCNAGISRVCCQRPWLPGASPATNELWRCTTPKVWATVPRLC